LLDRDHAYKVSYTLLRVSLKLSFDRHSKSEYDISGKAIDKFLFVTWKAEKNAKNLKGASLKKISKTTKAILRGKIDKIKNIILIP
jgi:hypothetical protein